jgi:glucokinase
MLLAGDIGGTKTLLGLFEPAADEKARPRTATARSFSTLDFPGLPDMVDVFLRNASVPRQSIVSAAFGVAGPVIGAEATLTNVPWRVEAGRIASIFGFPSVVLLNDLQALAYAVSVLEDSEVAELQSGRPQPDGNIAIIAAGTGLGEALLVMAPGADSFNRANRVVKPDKAGSRIPSPSEGGHADFAARTEREIVLLRDLTKRYGRADVEHVLSGRGLLNIHRISHTAPCTGQVDLDDSTAPAAITAAALEGRCAGCVETLDFFVEAYGAEAGNLALRSVSTGGVFVGGGIAPKILPALRTGAFVRAFRAKPPLDSLLEAIPVRVILNDEAGLLGAAVFAARY